MVAITVEEEDVDTAVAPPLKEKVVGVAEAVGPRLGKVRRLEDVAVDILAAAALRLAVVVDLAPAVVSPRGLAPAPRLALALTPTTPREWPTTKRKRKAGRRRRPMTLTRMSM